MLKKTITFTDYNGNTRTEEHYFNFTKAELSEMELSTVGGLAQMLRGLIAAQDMPSIIKFVKDLILKSYGKKSPDGRKFVKSPEISEDFEQTEAYSQLFMELCSNSENLSNFVNMIIPDDVRKEAERISAEEKSKEIVG